MSTVTPFLAAAADAKLEDWGPLEEATGEVMHTSGTTVWSGEGGAEAGVWECTLGSGPLAWFPAPGSRTAHAGRKPFGCGFNQQARFASIETRIRLLLVA